MSERLLTMTDVRVGRGIPGNSWPERTVKNTGVSPTNPKVKWAELSCGHTVYRQRRPRIGATIICTKCSEEER